MVFDKYRKIIKENLTGKLYRHSLGVADAAVTLAERYGADSQKAYLAGLLHDYGKGYTFDQLVQKAEEFSLDLDPITVISARLLHAPVGAVLLQDELAISDGDILDAVADHTTGRRGMSLLGKVIYLADYIEDNRSFNGVERIRLLAEINLDQALLVAVDTTIRSVLKRKLMLHPLTVDFRNSLLECSSRKLNKQ